MRIAFVGSRDVLDPRQVSNEIHAVLTTHAFDCVVVSGGARGVDSLAREAAEDTGCYYQEYPADWERYGKRAGFLRNQTIVDDCDEVHAWWDGQSKGTKHAIDLARRAGKPVTIHAIPRRAS